MVLVSIPGISARLTISTDDTTPRKSTGIHLYPPPITRQPFDANCSLSLSTSNSICQTIELTDLTAIKREVKRVLDTDYQRVVLHHREWLEQQLGPGIIPFEVDLATAIAEAGGQFHSWSRSKPRYLPEIYEVVECAGPSTDLVIDRCSEQ